MRISHERKDPGYHESIMIMPVKITCEGCDEDTIFLTADDTKNEAVVFVREANGKFKQDPKTGDIEKKLIKGKVTITFQCPDHKTYRAMRRPRCECKYCWAMWDFLSSR